MDIIIKKFNKFS